MRPAILKYLGTLVASTMLLMLVVVLPATATDLAIGYLSSSCDGDTASISWQIMTDRDGDAATHPLIRVEWRPESGGTWQTLGEGALNAGNSYVYADMASGIDLAGATRIDVRATAVPLAQGGAHWGDGRAAGDSYTSTLPVDPCTGDVDSTQYARVNWTAGCRSSSKQPAVMLFNDATPGADATITYDILATMDGVTFTDTVAVEPGFSAQVPLEFVSGGEVLSPEDRTIAVVVDIGDRTEFKRTFTVDCEDAPALAAPTASTAYECGSRDGLIIVELTNDSTTTSTFVITIDGVAVRTIDVTDDSETLRFPVEDGMHDVVVTADGVELANDSYDVDCVPDTPEPTVELDKECALDEVGLLSVSATNDGVDAVEFVVTIDGEVVDTFTLASGTDERTYEVGDGTHTISVTADGVEIGSDSFDVDCDDSSPAATIETACDEATGETTVTVANTQGADATFVLVLGGVEYDLGLIAAGDTGSVTLLLADGSYAFELSRDGEPVDEGTLLVTCGGPDVPAVPTASILGECDTTTTDSNGVGLITVDLDNATDEDVTYIITATRDNAGAFTETLTVAANDIDSITLPVAAGIYDVSVTVDGEEIATEILDLTDCTAVLGVVDERTPRGAGDGGLPDGAAGPDVSPTGLARTGLATDLLVPAALAMLILGFGLVGFARRRGEI